MPALDAVGLVEGQAEWVRAISIELGDTLLRLNRATEISRDDTCWRAELRGRIHGLRFALEAARRETL